MAKHTISKLFTCKPAKGDVVAEAENTPPDVVPFAKDASKEKKKKGKARRVFMGILKKTIPCASGRAHAIEDVADEDESFYDQRNREVTTSGAFEVVEGLIAQIPPRVIYTPPIIAAEDKKPLAQAIRPKIHNPANASALMVEVNKSVKPPVARGASALEVRERVVRGRTARAAASQAAKAPTNVVEPKKYHGRVIHPMVYAPPSQFDTLDSVRESVKPAVKPAVARANALEARERVALERIAKVGKPDIYTAVNRRVRFGKPVVSAPAVKPACAVKPALVNKVKKPAQPVIVQQLDDLEVKEPVVYIAPATIQAPAEIVKNKNRHARIVQPINYAAANELLPVIDVEETVKAAVDGDPVVLDEPESDLYQAVDDVETDEVTTRIAYTSFDAVVIGLSLLREYSDDESQQVDSDDATSFSDIALSAEVADVSEVSAVEDELAVSKVAPLEHELVIPVAAPVDAACITWTFGFFSDETLYHEMDDDVSVVAEHELSANLPPSMDKISTFGSLPLLDKDIIDDFINASYLSRQKSTVDDMFVTSTLMDVEESDTSVVESPGTSEELFVTTNGIEESSNGELSPLAGSCPSECDSSSPTTPVEGGKDCSPAVSSEESKTDDNEIVEEVVAEPVLSSLIQHVPAPPTLDVVPTSNPYAQGVPSRRVDIRGNRQRVLEGQLHIAANRNELMRTVLSVQEMYVSSMPDLASAGPIAGMSTLQVSRNTGFLAGIGDLARRGFGMLYKSRSTPGLRPLLLPLHINNREAYAQNL